jgi:hypothetical protein
MGELVPAISRAVLETVVAREIAVHFRERYGQGAPVTDAEAMVIAEVIRASLQKEARQNDR